jgi:hypothetical protein
MVQLPHTISEQWREKGVVGEHYTPAILINRLDGFATIRANSPNLTSKKSSPELVYAFLGRLWWLAMTRAPSQHHHTHKNQQHREGHCC